MNWANPLPQIDRKHGYLFVPGSSLGLGPWQREQSAAAWCLNSLRSHQDTPLSSQVPAVPVEAAACQHKTLPCSASLHPTHCGRDGRKQRAVPPHSQPPLWPRTDGCVLASLLQQALHGGCCQSGQCTAAAVCFSGMAELSPADMRWNRCLLRWQTCSGSAGCCSSLSAFLHPAANPQALLLTKVAHAVVWLCPAASWGWLSLWGHCVFYVLWDKCVPFLLSWIPEGSCDFRHFFWDL